MASLTLVSETTGLLKNLVECIRDRVAETQFIFDEQGMRLSTMDSSHVCLVNCFISADNFKEYHIEGGPVELGVSLGEFAKILKCGSNSDQITLEYNAQQDNDVLQITFTGVTNASFDMKLYDLSDEERLEVPQNLENQYEESIPCSDFSRIIKSIRNFSETVDIVRDERDRSAVLFIGNGDSVKNATFRFVVATPFNGVYARKFALQYLETFTKASSMTDTVTLRLLGEDQPPLLIVEYDIADDSFLQFYLAARLEDE